MSHSDRCARCGEPRRNHADPMLLCPAFTFVAPSPPETPAPEDLCRRWTAQVEHMRAGIVALANRWSMPDHHGRGTYFACASELLAEWDRLSLETPASLAPATDPNGRKCDCGRHLLYGQRDVFWDERIHTWGVCFDRPDVPASPASVERMRPMDPKSHRSTNPQDKE